MLLTTSEQEEVRNLIIRNSSVGDVDFLENYGEEGVKLDLHGTRNGMRYIMHTKLSMALLLDPQVRTGMLEAIFNSWLDTNTEE